MRCSACANMRGATDLSSVTCPAGNGVTCGVPVTRQSKTTAQRRLHDHAALLHGSGMEFYSQRARIAGIPVRGHQIRRDKASRSVIRTLVFGLSTFCVAPLDPILPLPTLFSMDCGIREFQHSETNSGISKSTKPRNDTGLPSEYLLSSERFPDLKPKMPDHPGLEAWASLRRHTTGDGFLHTPKGRKLRPLVQREGAPAHLHLSQAAILCPVTLLFILISNRGGERRFRGEACLCSSAPPFAFEEPCQGPLEVAGLHGFCGWER